MITKYDLNILTEEKWQAIITNDVTYNGKFIYAVKTTRIFCKPSCKSRTPIKENVTIFKNAKEALANGYRPCKRCKPTNERLPEGEWIQFVKNYIDNNFKEKITLELLAEVSHSSPYHLQRTFKKVTNLTPAEYTKKVRMKKACQLLTETNKRIAVIGEEIGISNEPYFVTTFKRTIGTTPALYRKKCHCK